MLVVGASLATVGGDHDFRDVFYKAGIALVVCCLAASSIF